MWLCEVIYLPLNSILLSKIILRNFFTFTKIFLFLRIFMESLDFRDDSEGEIMILKFSNPATRKGQALIHEM